MNRLKIVTITRAAHVEEQEMLIKHRKPTVILVHFMSQIV